MVAKDDKNNVLFIPGLSDKSLEEKKQTLYRLKRAAFTIFKKHNVVYLKAIGGSAVLNAHSLAIKIRGSCAAACGVDTCLIPTTETTKVKGQEKVVRVFRVEPR